MNARRVLFALVIGVALGALVAFCYGVQVGYGRGYTQGHVDGFHEACEGDLEQCG